MDSRRFDDLLRAFALGLSRRATLGAALSSLFVTGSLALDGDDAAAKRKHKKKKKVTLCLNGQTLTVPKKKRGKYLGQGATQGACAGPPRCGSADCDRCAQETCQAGTCDCPPNMIRDHQGICGTFVPCIGANQIASLAQECCAGFGTPNGTGQVICGRGTTRCQTTADCAGGGSCLGYMCPELYLDTVGQACRSQIGCIAPEGCDTGLCRDGVCVNCQSDNNCPSDQDGQCLCEDGICSNSGLIPEDGYCDDCPPGTVYCGAPEGGVRICHPVCGRRQS